MPKYISPLEDMYIWFDAAAEFLARRNGMSTPDGMLEMLTIAMWQGAFNPPSLFKPSDFDQSQRSDPENWLSIPIPQHHSMLSEPQRALKPRPVEYYEVNRKDGAGSALNSNGAKQSGALASTANLLRDE